MKIARGAVLILLCLVALVASQRTRQPDTSRLKILKELQENSKFFVNKGWDVRFVSFYVKSDCSLLGVSYEDGSRWHIVTPDSTDENWPLWSRRFRERNFCDGGPRLSGPSI